jgi:hypothetical protein
VSLLRKPGRRRSDRLTPCDLQKTFAQNDAVVILDEQIPAAYCHPERTAEVGHNAEVGNSARPGQILGRILQILW